MYVQQATEIFYMGLLATFLAFMAVFVWITSRKPPKKTEQEGVEPKGMERSERRWLAVLIVIAIVGNGIVLSTLIPSVRTAVWGDFPPAKTVYLTVDNYTYYVVEGNLTYRLDSHPINVTVGDAIEFDIWSNDVTYGFGAFRSDGSMVFQMQVVPGYQNTLVWIFDEPGSYTVRSTEYSGPNNWEMVYHDAIQVR